MINKLKAFEISTTQQILGGENDDTQTRIQEMARETALNRSKSASKIHNKVLQVLSA